MCYCSTVTLASLNQERGVLITDSLAELQASAEREDDACRLCQICWAALKQREPRMHKVWLERSIQFLKMDKETAIKQMHGKLSGYEEGVRLVAKSKFSIDEIHENEEDRQSDLIHKRGSCLQILPGIQRSHYSPPTIGVFAIANTLGSVYIPERYSALNAVRGQEACVEQIQTWLEECISHHQKCIPPKANGCLLPTRVIDVSDYQYPKLFQARLQEGKYLALSYCWGPPGEDTLKATSETVPGLLRGSFKKESFARTHQEAFGLARSLNIRYVWIDALCILQDDRDDWASESKKMGDIYGNAYLTVVAGSSVDARHGFIRDRVAIIEPFPIPLTSGEQMPFLFATCFPSLEEGPTSSRGWCFQEPMLSARSITFGVEQTYYRCASGTKYEFDRRNNITLREMGEIMPRPVPIFRPDLQLEHLSNGTQHWALLQHWYLVLRDFTSREFTNPGDVFASISSLAQRMEAHLQPGKGRYLAGIWEIDMVRGLLWRTRYANDKASILRRPVMRNGEQRGPSWSWAAVHGAIDHLDYDSAGIASHTAVRDSTAVNFVPDGKWVQDSAFNTNPKFIRVKPGIHVEGSNDRLWTRDTTCGASVLQMPTCELRMFGRVKKAWVSETQVNIRKWKPQHQWKPKTQQYNLNVYDGSRRRFEDALMNYAHGCYVFDGETSEDCFAVAVFDIAAEACQDIWCLQMTEVEGLLLRIDPLCDGKLECERRFLRLGLFWIEDLTSFADVAEVEVALI